MEAEDFAKERRKGIGGSDAAIIFDCSPYKKLFDLYLEKVGESKISNNKQELFARGHLIEELIKRMFTKKTKLNINKGSVEVHPEYDFIRGNIDGYISSEKAIIECKSSAIEASDGWGLEYTDQIPIHYLYQCHHYLLCKPEAQKVYILVLQNFFHDFNLICRIIEKYGFDLNFFNEKTGFKLKVYTIERNDTHEQIANIMIKKYTDFWNNCVLKRQPPPFKFSADVAHLLPQSTDGFAVADAEVLRAVQEIKSLKQTIKQYEEQEEMYKLIIFSAMLEKSVLFDPNKQKIATYKTQIKNQFDTETFKHEHPELYEKYKKQNLIRVLKLL